MNVRRLTIGFVYGTGVLIHVAAYLQYEVIRTRFDVPVDWDRDIVILLVISLGLMLVTGLKLRRYIFFLVVFFRFIVVACVSLPFENEQSVVWVLLAAVLLEFNTLYPPRQSGVLLGGGALILLVYQLAFGVFASAWSLAAHPALLIFVVIGVACGVLGRVLNHLLVTYEQIALYTGKLEATVGQMTEANFGFLEFASSAAHASMIRERKRITRDLHDVVGQTLTTIISMMNANIRNPVQGESALRSLFVWTRDFAQKGLQETRSILHELRSSTDVKVTGLRAIKNLVDTFEKSTGVAVRVDWGNSPVNFRDEVEDVVYHVVQEAMTNSIRHGKATRIEIQFWRDDDHLQVVLRDNGRSGTQEGTGLGLLGMTERARAAEGWVQCGRVKGGYEVTLRVLL